MSLVDRYTALTSSSTSSDVNDVLNAIIAGQATTTDARQKLVKLILDDLQNKTGSRINGKDQATAILALKTLGREPDASQLLATKPALKFLLTITSVSEQVSRTIANALLLQSQGRQNFIDVGGGDYALTMLSSSSDPTTLFIASRLLFLCTADASNVKFMGHLLDDTNVLEAVSGKIDMLTKKVMKSNEGRQMDPMVLMALSDMLKFVFNMVVHYSRDESGGSTVLGEAFSKKFDPWVPLLLRTFMSLPPSMSLPTPVTAPMTHTIACLLSIPIEGYESYWFPSRRAGSPPNSLSGLTSRARSLFSGGSGTTSTRPRSRQPSPAPSSSSSNEEKESDHVTKAFEIVCKSLEHYFPMGEEVDSDTVRQRQTKEDVRLDDLLPPVLLFLRKIARENEPARRRIKSWILPDDLDRTNPLEERDDILGRLIRLLGSVYFSKLNSSAGEILFAICDSTSSTLVDAIGYGNAAGFLMNNNILVPPPSIPSSSTSTSAGGSAPINPITGTVLQEPTNSAMDDMTEEEREREAERLFVLFERLERSGIAQNPIRVAQQEGRLEQYREAAERKEEEDSDD